MLPRVPLSCATSSALFFDQFLLSSLINKNQTHEYEKVELIPLILKAPEPLLPRGNNNIQTLLTRTTTLSQSSHLEFQRGSALAATAIPS
jgi:hypothetical protein